MISIPFSGSKKYSYKIVKEIVEKGGYTSVYEPFGGSCILSVNLYNDGLVNRAVTNDYDRFFDLYPEYLDLKDKVVKEGYEQGIRRTIQTGKPRESYKINLDGTREKVKSHVLSSEDRLKLQNIIKNNVPEKYWRYFSLGCNFMYSAVSSHEKIKLNDFILFNSYLNTDKQRKYLEVLNDIELEHLDWRDFLDKHRKQIDKNSLIILDPPYTGTAQGQYKESFSESDTLELLEIVKDIGSDFIFFNHDIDKVREWLKGMDYEISLTGSSISSANRKRKDVMAYVKVN